MLALKGTKTRFSIKEKRKTISKELSTEREENARGSQAETVLEKYMNVKFRRWGNLMMVTMTRFTRVLVCVRVIFIHCDAIGKSASTVGKKEFSFTEIFITFAIAAPAAVVGGAADEKMFTKYDTSRVFLHQHSASTSPYLFFSIVLLLRTHTHMCR